MILGATVAPVGAIRALFTNKLFTNKQMKK
jgi:hypothetical protein